LPFSGHAQGLQLFLVVRGPKLNAALKMRPHQCGIQRDDHLLLLLAALQLIQARTAPAFLASWAHCWLMLSCCQLTPQILFLRADFQPPWPKPVVMYGAVGHRRR